MLRDLFSDLRFRLRAIFGGARLERDLDDELRFHVETETARLIASGVAPADAASRARRAFGNMDQVKEYSRDSRGIRMLDLLRRDVVHAMRVTAKRPGFTAVVALSLALGIGATTGVMNLTWDLLMAPLAVPHPEQLISLERVEQEGRDNSFTWREYEALRATTGAGHLESVRSASAVTFAIGEQKEQVNVHFVSGGYFPMIGAEALKGRVITEHDDETKAPVVVLSWWFAHRVFPSDSSAVGRTVLIRDLPFTVIGVMPRSFHGLEFPGWFTAAIPEGATTLLGTNGPGRDNRGQPYGAGDTRQTDLRAFRIVGRVTTSLAGARAVLGVAFQQCCQVAGPRQTLDVQDIRYGIDGGKNQIRPQARMVVTMLFAAMALVLIVVCCNIAGLLLVRASARQREIAVRLSLGASRARLVTQLMMESVPAALCGAAGAAVFGAWATSALIARIPEGMLGGTDAVDMLRFQWMPMLGFAIVVALLCTIAFAVLPALRATNQPLAQTLRLDSRASRSRRQSAVGRLVVVAQVAVTLVLVTAAALFTATLGHLTRADGGFASSRMLLAGLETRSTSYEQRGIAPLAKAVLDRVRAVPGVREAGLSTTVPLFGGTNWSVPVGNPGAVAAKNQSGARLISILPGYFSATGIRIMAGRDFTDGDQDQSQPVAIVSQSFVRKFFPGTELLEHSIAAALSTDTLTTVRIVGIAGDVTYDDLRSPPDPALYLPLSQTPGTWQSAQIVVRTTGEPGASGTAVRRAVEAAAPGLVIRRMQNMEDTRATSTAFVRLGERLATFVSAMALLLSAIGLYGVVAYSVSRRTSEIGIRLALGARTRAVLWLVARETVVMVGIGVLVGMPLSFMANGMLASQLFGIGPHDPLAAGASVILLAAAGVVASIIPARAASRIDARSALNAD